MVTKEEKEYILKAVSLLLRPEAATVVSHMLGKEAVGEEWLSKQCNLKVTVVRKILYDLFSMGLVEFIKERDEKTGWYIYNASFKIDKFNEIIIEKLKMTHGKLIQRLKYEEENNFYECPVHKKKFLESEALINNYKCDVESCDEILVPIDKSRRIEKLKRKIDEIERIIKIAEEKGR